MVVRSESCNLTGLSDRYVLKARPLGYAGGYKSLHRSQSRWLDALDVSCDYLILYSSSAGYNMRSSLGAIIYLASLVFIACGGSFAWSFIKHWMQTGKTGALNFAAQKFNDIGVLNKYSWLYLAFSILAPALIIYNYVMYIPDGTYCYNVIVRSDSGEYTLPAEVVRHTEVDEYEDSYYDTRTRSWQEMGLYRFYWPNGGYCEFDPYWEEINTEKFSFVSDYNTGDEYEVRLTTQRTSHPKIVEEIEKKSVADFYFIIPAAFVSLIMFFAQIANPRRSKVKSQKQENKEQLFHELLGDAINPTTGKPFESIAEFEAWKKSLKR